MVGRSVRARVRRRITLWDLALEDDPDAEKAEAGRDDLRDIPSQCAPRRRPLDPPTRACARLSLATRRIRVLAMASPNPERSRPASHASRAASPVPCALQALLRPPGAERHQGAPLARAAPRRHRVDRRRLAARLQARQCRRRADAVSAGLAVMVSGAGRRGELRRYCRCRGRTARTDRWQFSGEQCGVRVYVGGDGWLSTPHGNAKRRCAAHER
eukprot:2554206-Prymnesium_polylepis.3